MGLADGEGAGDTARTEGEEWAGSGKEEMALAVTGVPDALAVAEDTTMAGATGEPKRNNSIVRGESQKCICFHKEMPVNYY